MLGLLVSTRPPDEPHPSAPILPDFLRRALRALLKRR